jgi:uncharacterized protein
MIHQTVASDHCIMLQSGRLFDLANPEDSEIDIGDIAHGLAHTCRYAGQCSEFFSVAEHSVLVSHVAAAAPFEGLMHDAAEAFVGDMVGPLKRLVPEYKTVEKRIERAIFRHFDLAWPAPDEVKAADYSVMAAEQLVLMPPGTNPWLADVKPAQVRIAKLAPAAAKRLFLDRYFELISGRAANKAPKQTRKRYA